jgi:hypothetical protein
MYEVIDALFMKIVERLFKFIAEMAQTPDVISPTSSAVVVTHNTTNPNGTPNALSPNPLNNINNNNSTENLAVLTPTTDIEREILDVKKVYYTFLSTIVGSNLTNVLRSPSK